MRLFCAIMWQVKAIMEGTNQTIQEKARNKNETLRGFFYTYLMIPARRMLNQVQNLLDQA